MSHSRGLLWQVRGCHAYLIFLCLMQIAGTGMAEEQGVEPGVQSADTSEVYTDQLIDPGVADEVFDSRTDGFFEEPEGRRFFNVQYRHFLEDLDEAGTSYEDGILLQWRRETQDLGELDMFATLRHLRGDDLDIRGPSTGGVLTLRQHGFALSNRWLMDNAAGVLRTTADPVISSSYRINLPSSLMAGAQLLLDDGVSQWRFNAGRLGSLGTGQVDAFDSRDGLLANLGYSRQFNVRWRGGLHLVHLNDHDRVEDHQSVVGLLQYETPDRNQRYQIHTLNDSKGNFGVWLDGENRIGRWRHRYGTFRLEPNLLWTDVPVTNDQQGLYARSEFRTFRFFMSGGADYRETDIKDDPRRTGTRTTSGFINGTWRVRASTSLGGTLSAVDSRPHNGGDGDDNRTVRLTGFVSQSVPIGITRLQLSVADLNEGNDGDGQIYGVIWDQDWNFIRTLSLSTSLSHARSSGSLDEDRRDSASLLLRHDFSSRFNWNSSFSYTRVEMNTSNTQDGYNANLGVGWRFLPDWDAGLQLVWNRTDTDFGRLSDNERSVTDKSLMLSIRHSRRSGRPIVAEGQRHSGQGYGKVAGQVFYDRNGDGVRQAGEEAAEGVPVYLDGRYERLTDHEGRFLFSPVPVGEHHLSLALEDVPLPWGLEDETPQPVSVSVREQTEHSVGLVRIE